MKILVSSLVALTFIGSSAVYAHPRAPASTAALTAASLSDQARQPSSHNLPLYYRKAEDVSNSLYWTTPKSLGGGLETNRGAAALSD